MKDEVDPREICTSCTPSSLHPLKRPRSSGVERLLGKEEVMSSNLIAGSIVTNTGS